MVEAEEVVPTEPEAKEPPLAAVMEKKDDVVQDKLVVLPPQEQPGTKAAAKAPVAEPAVKKSSKGSFELLNIQANRVQQARKQLPSRAGELNADGSSAHTSDQRTDLSSIDSLSHNR